MHEIDRVVLYVGPDNTNRAVANFATKKKLNPIIVSFDT